MPVRLAAALLVCLVVGCAPQQASDSPTPSSAASPSAASPSAVASSPATPSAPAPSSAASSGSAGTFTVCPSATEAPTCPLEPGPYTVAVHDPFSFSIAEAGWQEERATAGEFETRVVVSRVADPQQRLTFLSGSTGPAGPVTLDPAAFDIPGFKVGQPSDVTISAMPGKYIDIEPDGSGAAASVAIDTQTIPVDPGRAYRFTIVRIPMDQEAATVIMVTEAPTDAFATFVELADQVIRSVEF